MQENEFEKQVKTTIDGFRLRPSEPVWMNIREEIREKRRRRILLLIPILAILLGLGYFTWQSFYATNKIQNEQKNSLLNNITDNKNRDAKNTTSDQPRKIIAEKDTAAKLVTESKPSGGESRKNSTVADDKKKLAGSLNNKKKLAKSLTAPDQRISNAVENNKKALVNNGHEQTEIDVSENKKIPVHSNSHLVKNEISDAAENPLKGYIMLRDAYANKKGNLLPDNKPVIIEYRGVEYKTMNSIAENKLTIQETSPVKNNNGLKETGKIKWGLEFAVGGSTRSDQPFKVGSTEKSAAYSGSFFNSPVSIGTTGNFAGGLLVLPASDVKPGAAFKLGVVIDKPLSKRMDISTGLRYVYASDHITIGKTISSNSNTVLLMDRSNATYAVAQTSYSGMQPQNYTNKYHFIELPLTVHFNLNPKWKIPLIWNAGASVSRLITSNALLYDEAWGGVYYKGNNDLAKTQFGIMTGFSLRFKGNNKWQWSIGPQLSMNTTKLFQSTADKNKHIVYGGINLQLMFPGKKK